MDTTTKSDKIKIIHIKKKQIKGVAAHTTNHSIQKSPGKEKVLQLQTLFDQWREKNLFHVVAHVTSRLSVVHYELTHPDQLLLLHPLEALMPLVNVQPHTVFKWEDRN